MIRSIAIGVAALFALVVLFGAYRTFNEPSHLYKHAGTFAQCPSRPSCVSSHARGEQHAIDAVDYNVPASVAIGQAVATLESMDGVVSVERDGNYAHAVFATPTVGFRDDFEILVDVDGRIEVRSISRFGYRDFGVNRERVETFRERFDSRENFGLRSAP